MLSQVYTRIFCEKCGQPYQVLISGGKDRRWACIRCQSPPPGSDHEEEGASREGAGIRRQHRNPGNVR